MHCHLAFKKANNLPIVCKPWKWFSKKNLCQIDWQEKKDIKVFLLFLFLWEWTLFIYLLGSSWFVNYLFMSLICLSGGLVFSGETWAQEVTAGQGCNSQLFWDHLPSLLCLNPAGSGSRLQVNERSAAWDCGGWAANAAADATSLGPRSVKGAGATISALIR